MEPSSPQPTPETAPPLSTPETINADAVAQPEAAPSAPEREVTKEGASQGGPISLPPIAVPNQTTATPVVEPPQPVQADPGAGPTVADDVDLIEREWVDKAKAIVKETRDDPHKQEREVSKLQADYLRKRYGKEIKLPSE